MSQTGGNVSFFIFVSVPLRFVCGSIKRGCAVQRLDSLCGRMTGGGRVGLAWPVGVCVSVTLWGGFSGGSPLILCLSMALPSRSTWGGGLKDVGKCVDKTSTEK